MDTEPQPLAPPLLDGRPIGQPKVDENGVDLWQIEDCLRLTPAERLEQHRRARQAVETFRRAGEQFYGRLG